MQPQLEAAAERILAVRSWPCPGAGRLPLTGCIRCRCRTPRVWGVELTRRQGPDLWGTDATSQGSTALADVRGEGNADVRTELNQGPDLAIVIALTNNPHSDVVASPRAANLPVREVLALRPLAGSADDVVAGPGNAVAWVQTLRRGSH